MSRSAKVFTEQCISIMHLFFPSYENIYKLIEKKTKIITKTTTDNTETMSHVVTSVRVSKSIVFFVFLSYVFTISAHKH